MTLLLGETHKLPLELTNDHDGLAECISDFQRDCVHVDRDAANEIKSGRCLRYSGE